MTNNLSTRERYRQRSLRTTYSLSAPFVRSKVSTYATSPHADNASRSMRASRPPRALTARSTLPPKLLPETFFAFPPVVVAMVVFVAP
jgi:hypothetical protein